MLALALGRVEDLEGLIEHHPIGALYAQIPQTGQVSRSERQALLEDGLPLWPLGLASLGATWHCFKPALVLLWAPGARRAEFPAHRRAWIERRPAAQAKAAELARDVELQRELPAMLDLPAVEDPKLRLNVLLAALPSRWGAAECDAEQREACRANGPPSWR